MNYSNRVIRTFPDETFVIQSPRGPVTATLKKEELAVGTLKYCFHYPHWLHTDQPWSCTPRVNSFNSALYDIYRHLGAGQPPKELLRDEPFGVCWSGSGAAGDGLVSRWAGD